MKVIMKDKSFIKILIFLVIEAVLGIAVAVTHCTDNDIDGIDFLTSPVEWFVKILRHLSLSGNIGNSLAIGLYILVCGAPLILFVVILAKNKIAIEDTILIAISAMAFPVIYWGINPSTMPIISDSANVRMNENLYVTALFSVILAYIIIKIVRTIGGAKEDNIYTALRALCAVLMAVVVLKIFGDELLKMLSSFFKQKLNSENTVDQVFFTRAVIVMQFVVDQISYMYLLVVAKLGWDAVPKIKENIINTNTNGSLAKLTKVNKVYLIVAALAQVGLNFIQLVLRTNNNIVNLKATFPLGIMMMAIVLIVIEKLIDRGAKLQEENDLFI